MWYIVLRNVHGKIQKWKQYLLNLDSEYNEYGWLLQGLQMLSFQIQLAKLRLLSELENIDSKTWPLNV